MMPPLELTEPERVTLQERADRHPYPDFHHRALGILALGKGHPFAVVADILGVTLPTPYNWAKAWIAKGLVGLLNGHQGGAPAKLTAALLDTAEAVARAAPCTLAQIDQALRERHPDAPPFSLDWPGKRAEKPWAVLQTDTAIAEKNAAPTSSRPRKSTSSVARTRPGRAS